ncbi:MAG: hypothetical protein AUJ34_01530 [Parcubacteria group bacterium CG1_02_41_12]|nr:MAG: hypothetical protein AUJ34_01530 [Parcubacteria group bacterium CG1_02_41_12]PIP67072.1 MAG: hypothetical protein COW93_02185 [Parcubacteria group bacterium CG22_combo_CG10-13_8_21_14_all_41_9]PIQ80208.1 MAG: hypothetical protein COV79_01695 [Parcubacteria group bacterium CG11_big_fil_rev_8_21_14_0_20_41_14]PIR57421.1 MAG: hypothetical protein COU72_01030 [Parcubacteria group bacterium CG10_big_fil_rev_8_21_14_0_10_41_35]
MFDIITIGSAVRDIFLFLDPKDAPVIKNPACDPRRKELLALEFGAKIDVKDSCITVGGGGINTAVTFARAKLKVGSVLSVGCDTAGGEIISVLKKEKISAKFVHQNSGTHTGFSTLIVSGEKKKDRTILVARGASDLLNFDQKDGLAQKTKWYYLTALSGKNWKKELSDIFSVARDRNIKIAWNPGSLQLKAGASELKKYMKLCEIFLVNKDEAYDLVGVFDDMGSVLSALRDLGSKGVIVSDGINGAYYSDSDSGMIHAKADKSIRAIEPTGAGDAFGSAFVARLIKNCDDIQGALDFGIKNAESVIQKIGAQKGILYV